jgi:hypothetical protein
MNIQASGFTSVCTAVSSIATCMRECPWEKLTVYPPRCSPVWTIFKTIFNNTAHLKWSQDSDRLRAGWLGFNFWQGQGIFLVSITSRPAIRPTQPPIQWIRGAGSPVVKRSGCEAIPSLPNTSSWCSAWVIMHRDNFYGAFETVCYFCAYTFIVYK